jgi:hypothetical protein
LTVIRELVAKLGFKVDEKVLTKWEGQIASSRKAMEQTAASSKETAEKVKAAARDKTRAEKEHADATKKSSKERADAAKREAAEADRRLKASLAAHASMIQAERRATDAAKAESTKRIEASKREAAQRRSAIAGGVARGIMAVGGAAVGVGAGALAFTMQWAEQADKLAKDSAKLDVPIDQLQRMKFAADRSGVSADSLGQSFREMNKRVTEGRANEQSPIAKVAKEIGLSLDDISQMEPEKRFGAIADALSTIEDPAIRVTAAQQFFGKSASDLGPLLAEGSDGIRALGDEAERLGMVMSADTAAAAEELQDKITNLKARASGLGSELATVLVPVLGDVADRTSDWIEENDAFLKQDLPMAIKEITTAMMAMVDIVAKATVGWGSLLREMRSSGDQWQAFKNQEMAMFDPGRSGELARRRKLLETRDASWIPGTGLSRAERQELAELQAGIDPQNRGKVTAADRARFAANRQENEQQEAIAAMDAAQRARASAEKALPRRRARAGATDSAVLSALSTGGEKEAKGSSRRGGGAKSKEQIELERLEKEIASGEIGADLRERGELHGVAEVGIASAIRAVAAAMQKGAVESVAVKAGRDTLDKLSGGQMKGFDRDVDDILQDFGAGSTRGKAGADGVRPTLGTTINRVTNEYRPEIRNEFKVVQRDGENSEGLAHRVRDLVVEEMGNEFRKGFDRMVGAVG